MPACWRMLACPARHRSNDELSSFSNYGPGTVNIAAPGESVMATSPSGGYETAWGTSMAAPLVSQPPFCLN